MVGGRGVGTTISQSASAEENASLTSGVRGHNWQNGWRPWQRNSHSNNSYASMPAIQKCTINLKDFKYFYNNKKDKVVYSHLKDTR